MSKAKIMSLKELNALAARVEQVRAECDAFITNRAAELQRECGGVPVGVIRQSIAPGRCQCDTIRALLLKENAA
jgi:hypothetical protein